MGDGGGRGEAEAEAEAGKGREKMLEGVWRWTGWKVTWGEATYRARVWGLEECLDARGGLV